MTKNKTQRKHRWRVGRTHEEQPCEQYVVFRTGPDGSREVFQYSDTKADALRMAEQANAGLAGIPCHCFMTKNTGDEPADCPRHDP
jgi:hypothetical protein